MVADEKGWRFALIVSGCGVLLAAVICAVVFLM
jgi:hypothetical protein